MHVVKSAEDFLYLSEGTIKINTTLSKSEEESVEVDKDTILSYAFSPEEIEANLMGINVALEDKFLLAQTREQLEAAKAVFEKGKELMDLRKRLLIAPMDREKYSLVLDSICKKIELWQKMEELLGVHIARPVDKCMKTLEEFFELAEAVPLNTPQEEIDELQEKLKIAAEAAYLGFSILGLNPEIDNMDFEPKINNEDFDPFGMLDESVPYNIDLKRRILATENEIARNLEKANLNFLPIEYFQEAS